MGKSDFVKELDKDLQPNSDFFACSLQLSSCCFILKQGEQFASYRYVPRETIVERIEIISPHSQDFNTENRIKCLIRRRVLSVREGGRESSKR